MLKPQKIVGGLGFAEYVQSIESGMSDMCSTGFEFSSSFLSLGLQIPKLRRYIVEGVFRSLGVPS